MALLQLVSSSLSLLISCKIFDFHLFLANVDYQGLDTVLEFRPEDFVMCVSINSTTDSTFEGLEPLAVFVQFLSQIIASVRVDIIDSEN